MKPRMVARLAHNLANKGAQWDDAYDMAVCVGKTHYWTEEQAVRAAEFYKDQKGYDQEPYVCPICGEYHLRTKRDDEDENS